MRYMVVGLLALGRCMEIVAAYGIVLTCMSCVYSSSFVGSRVFNNLHGLFMMFAILYK